VPPETTTKARDVDVVVVGASLSAAAAAKRLVDAGLETLVLERKALPRHKVCSGILAPRGHRFLIENFGPLPREVLHEPTACRGVTFHFPKAPSLSMDFDGGPTAHLHRRFSDYWAIRRSGARVLDKTAVVSLADDGERVTVQALHEGRPATWRARYVIGADGPTSVVVQSVYPEYRAQIPWFWVGQKFHRIKECPLDTEYFHFWFHPDLGHYTWSHARDGRQIVGVGFEQGGNFDRVHARVAAYLEERHGVKLEPAEDPEGSPENFGPSLINRYVFGRGNVLVTGQAAGFLNMMAEGMSCALHSGAIAGEAVVEASLRGRPVQDVYRKMIASEVRHCSDQWNPLKIAFGHPHEADFRAALRRLRTPDQLRLLFDVWSFVKLFGGHGWGRQMLGQAASRLFRDGYDPRRWL
jgi:flavin-dependent dehydrogenase